MHQVWCGENNAPCCFLRPLRRFATYLGKAGGESAAPLPASEGFFEVELSAREGFGATVRYVGEGFLKLSYLQRIFLGWDLLKYIDSGLR